MAYQPNVVNAGDRVEINGVVFEVKRDFQLCRDRKLVLIPVKHERRFFVANSECSPKPPKFGSNVVKRND